MSAFSAQIEANISNFTKNLDKATQDINKFQDNVAKKLDKIGDSFVNIGTKASILSAGLVAVGTKAFLMAADIEDAIGATEQIFGDNANSVNAWASKLDSSFGVAKKEALEYSNLMGTMLINIGKLTEEEASKQSAKLIELAGDLTAMYGGSTHDAVRALTGALKGNNTMLDNYGMAVNEALIKQKALELGLIGTSGEMTLQAKPGATLALIWEQTGAAQGQAAREADSASGGMRALKTEITNLSTELGEVLLPIITPIISGIREFVSRIRDLSPEAKKVTVVVAGIVAAVGPLLLGLGGLLKILPLIGAGFTAVTGPIGIAIAAVAGAAALIISNWDTIKAYFTTGDGAEMFSIVKEMATELKNGLVGTFNDIKRLVTYVWDAMGSDIVKILKNAFSVIGAVVGTLVKTFKNVIQVLDGLFRLDFKTVLDGLKNLFVDIFSGISKIVLNAVSSISSALAGLFDLIGMDKWAIGLRRFSEKLTPAMQSATESTEETTAAIEDQLAAVDALNKSLGNTAEIVELDTFQKLIGEQLNVRDAVNKTVSTIEELQSKLVKLQLGILPSTNVRQELAETQQQINDLSTALDLLTGGRELNIKVNANISGIEAAENKFLKDGKFALPPIDTSALDASMGDLSQKAQAIKVTVGDVLGNLFADASTAIMEGDNVMTALASSMLGMLGGIMVELGRMALDIGIGLEAIQKALMSLNPALAIGAGVALIALGSLFSAGSRKLASSMGGGGAGYSSAPSLRNTGPGYAPSEYRGAYQDDFKVEFKIGTNELVGVLNTAEQRRNRIG